MAIDTIHSPGHEPETGAAGVPGFGAFRGVTTIKRWRFQLDGTVSPITDIGSIGFFW